MVAGADRPLLFARIIESLLPAGSPRPTGREMAVGYLVFAEGLSAWAAAERLSIEDKTAEAHLRHLAERLDLRGVRALRAAVTAALWNRVA